jgi:hypothetical protein
MCGALVLVLVDWLVTGPWRARLLLVLVILTLARVHVASWQRLPWRDHWRGIAAEPLALRGRPLILLPSKPTGFLALSLPADARYVDFSCGEIDLCGPATSLTRQFRADLDAEPAFSLYAVLPANDPPQIAAHLDAFGLRLGTQCQRLDLMERGYRICNVLR